MIIVTGAAGFIASCLVSKLNNKGLKEIVVVDDFSREEKNRNLKNKSYLHSVDRHHFFEWLKEHHTSVDYILHLGARTDTTEFDTAIFDALNLNYSKSIWQACCEYQIPLIYASSAATYGDGSLGYTDSDAVIPSLLPLNPYGISKNEFDKWVLLQTNHPPVWHGLKFFNVYGPNEYHKGRMASVILHAYLQITRLTAANTRISNPIAPAGVVKLFRSHRPEYKDGEQLRDFIYVKDVVDVIYFLMNHRADSGIYNLGTGKARSFLDLAKSVFAALSITPHIEFIDTPIDIRDKYQYFTEANMEKLKSIGYPRPFHSLEDGVEEYVQGYLRDHTFF